MKLHSLRLQNFRAVVDRSIEFPASGVVIVQGPNEVGKTSMVEGLDLLLTEKDSAKKQLIRDVQPVSRDEPPAVTAEISAGSYRFIYSKQWLKAPATHLQILKPQPESLTGAAAHDRVEQILREAVDRELFDALRVLQGRAVDKQVELRGNAALRAALESASGTTLDSDAGSENLVAAVAAEYTKYFTARGKATGNYRQMELDFAAAQAAVASAEESLAAAEEQVARHERFLADEKDLAARLEKARENAELNQKRFAELEQHTLAVTRAQTALDQCAQDLQVAQRELDEREELQKAYSQRVQTAEKQQAAAVIAGKKLQELSRQMLVCEKSVTDASAMREKTQQRVSDLQRRVEYRSKESELKREEVRLTDAEAATKKLEAAVQALARYTVTDELFERVRSAEQQVQISRTLLQESAAQLAVAVTEPEEVVVDGAAVAIEPEAALALPVSKAIDLRIGTNVRVTITPASGGTQRVQALEDAEAELARALSAAGVADITEARDSHAKQRENTAAKAAAQNQLDGLLGVDTLEELRARVAVLRQQVASADLEAAMGAEFDEAALTEQLENAERELHTRVAALEQARASLRELEEELTTARIEAATTQSAAEAAAAESERSYQQLQVAENSASRASLEHAVGQAEEAHKVALEKLESCRQELQKHDPESVEAHLKNSLQVVERLVDELTDIRSEIHRSQGLLEAIGSEGRAVALDEALTTLETTREAYNRVKRQAEAANLLHTTIQKYQEQTWQRYVAPFQERITALGRLIFGPEVHFEITPDLEIKSRTIGRDTVAFSALSTGAQEQIGILARLACAQLVSETGGVPVMIDDALGNTDPQRLSGLGTALTQAGRTVQVIVLTCTPERYRDVGEASVIRL